MRKIDAYFPCYPYIELLKVALPANYKNERYKCGGCFFLIINKSNKYKIKKYHTYLQHQKKKKIYSHSTKTGFCKLEVEKDIIFMYAHELVNKLINPNKLDKIWSAFNINCVCSVSL